MRYCLYPKLYMYKWLVNNTKTFLYKEYIKKPHIQIYNRPLKDIFITIKLVNINLMRKI